MSMTSIALAMTIVPVVHSEDTSPSFAPPVPIMAAGEPIDAATGHAAPYVYDFNGDGVRDLLVGEFGVHPFKGETTGKAGPGHAWVGGKLRFYANHGTDHDPVYDDFTYVQAGGQDAQVPITCCVSFVPQFIDFTGDGIDDLVSGSYPGDIYFFTGKGDGTFEAPILQRNIEGDPAHATQEHKGEFHSVHSITAELHDMDGDDDLDLVVGSRLNGCYTIENIGTNGEMAWAVRSSRMKSSDGKPIGGWDYGSNVHFADWDEDGISDIVVGSEDGGVFWHRNQGTENTPVFGAMQTLLPERSMGEKFLKLSNPMGPQWRVKVHVVDYDGDGLKDLLVGDFGSRHTRRRTLTIEEKAELSTLDGELNAMYAKDEMDAADEARSEDIYDRMEELETHDSHTTGYVWFHRRLSPEVRGGIARLTGGRQSSSNDAVRLRSQGDTIDPARPFAVTVMVTIPDGWAACGNEEVIGKAGTVGLPTSIEWRLPEGCTIADTVWQDADEHGLYEKTFAVEAIIDASEMKATKDDSNQVIAAKVSYQRCDKKSGVCIRESSDVQLPVTVDPS